MGVEEFQELISRVEKKELDDLKERIYKSDESDPPRNLEIFISPFISYNHDTQKTPSYFQVQRFPEDDFILDEIDKADFQRCILSKNSDMFKYEVAWLLSNDSAFNIWDSVMKAAKRIGDCELYEKTITGLATLVMCLYSPETLCRRHHYGSHHSQRNELWKQIEQPNTPYIPGFCNDITRQDINYNDYPLVTQEDTDEFIVHYATKCIYGETGRIRAPYADCPPPQRKKNDMFNEIHAVIAKMESPTRMKGDLDEYTRLLIRLASENSWGKEKELADRVMSIINTSCNDWKSDMEIHILCMIKSEQLRIQGMSSRVSEPLYHLVYDSEKCVHDPCLVYGNQMCVDAPRVFVCTDVWNVIEIGEFRREALGSRFIKKKHLLWAFYELGFGLPLEYMREKAFKLAGEDEDRPPYHIYLVSIKLARSLGNGIVQLQHFIFVLLFLEDTDDAYAKDLDLDWVTTRFWSFLRVVADDCLMRPNDNARLWLKNWDWTPYALM